MFVHIFGFLLNHIIEDTWETKYVAWNRVWFIDYKRISTSRTKVILDYKTWEEVIGVGAY